MHVKTPADTATTITVSVCPRCGIIGKSDKMSCCARGGSWFKNCGGAGNARLQHTWYDGIQACKTRSQSKRAIGHQLNGAQQRDTDSSEGAGMTNYKAVTTATETFTFTPVNTSTKMSDTTSTVASTITKSALALMTNMSNTSMTYSTHTSDGKAIVTQGRVYVLAITAYIFL